jgi:hypothetical protein
MCEACDDILLHLWIYCSSTSFTNGGMMKTHGDDDEYCDDNDEVHNHIASHEGLAYDEFDDERAHFQRHHQQRRFKQVASYICRVKISDSEKRGMATLMSRWVEFAHADETLEEAVSSPFMDG